MLVSAPVLAAQPGYIHASDSTQSVSDNQISISYVIGTEGNQQLRNVSVEVVAVDGPLEVKNKSVTIQKVAGDETRTVLFDVYVPPETANTEYNVTAELRVGNQAIDSANYTVDVHDGGSNGNEDGDSGESTDTTTQESSGGGAVMGVSPCEGWLCKINRLIDFDFDFDLGDFWDGLFSDMIALSEN